MNKLNEFLIQHEIPCEYDVDLRKKTWIHRGGKCKIFVTPSSIEQLEILVRYLYINNIHFLVVGHTSNLYIHNDTDIDVIVSTRNCNRYSFNQSEIVCDCGASVIKLSSECVKLGISGFEYLLGLPGTVAGALYNNSSCKQNSISNLLIALKLIREDGEVMILEPKDMNFSFRNSILKEKKLKGVIISCRLRLLPGNSSDLQKIAIENREERKILLEGGQNNLGCTVNRCFINGPMPKRYSLPLKFYSKLLVLLHVSREKFQEKTKSFLLFISGYSELASYISNKQMIIFVWRDENADLYFSRYLEFMKKVYKTDKIEIEEV